MVGYGASGVGWGASWLGATGILANVRVCEVSAVRRSFFPMTLTAVPEIAMLGQALPSPQVQKLLDDMKATAASRFNAAKRLEANDRNLTWITAMTSAYIIALTVLPYFWKLSPRVTDTLNLVTVVLSIVILVSALLHNSKRDAVNAEQHHRSALDVGNETTVILCHRSFHRAIRAFGGLPDRFLKIHGH
jgi:hypothetical protein